LRADKAEKLHAALEETHARLSTENERLSLELATAKERQAEAVQRVLELDNRLETMSARAGAAAPAPVADPAAAVKPAAPTPDGTGAGKAPAPAQQPAAGSMANGGSKVVYEVRAEDTLSRIAAKVYGDASAWRRIFDANRDVLNGPDELRLGMRLIIP
jgi:nucleoid-associated protein YgaU